MLKILLALAASLPSKARTDEKKIIVPDGDHTGPALLATVSLVSGVAPDPSAFITQTFKVELVLAALLPSRARCELKAILLPSGDYSGKSLLAALAVTLVSGVAPEPSAFIAQTLKVKFGLIPSLPSRARVD